MDPIILGTVLGLTPQPRLEEYVEKLRDPAISAVEKAKLCQELRKRFPNRYPRWEELSWRIGVEVVTVRAWVRTLDLPVEVQAKIAPRGDERRVPEGKIDYQTALRVMEKIKDKQRLVEVVKRLAGKKLPHRVANEIIRQASAEPDQAIAQIAVRVEPTLKFSPRNLVAIFEGAKTQTTRRHLDPRIKPGLTIAVSLEDGNAELVVANIVRKRLRKITKADARREGAPTLEAFKEQWMRQYGGWNEEEKVSLVRFEPVNEREG